MNRHLCLSVEIGGWLSKREVLRVGEGCIQGVLDTALLSLRLVSAGLQCPLSQNRL